MSVDIYKLLRLYHWANVEGEHEVSNGLYTLQTHGIPNQVPADQNHFYSLNVSRQGDYPCYFHIDRSKEPQLQALLTKAEELYMKGPYALVRQSPLVAQVIQERRELVKKGTLEALALEIHKIKNSGNFIEGMRSALKLAGVVREIPFIVATTDSRTYIFDGLEEDIVHKINELPSKRNSPTPKKVLVKMAALRIYKFRKAVSEFQENRKKYPSSYASDKRATEWVIPDLNSKDALQAALSQASGFNIMNSFALDPYKEFLQRSEVDDEIMQDAWNRVLVGDVMET